MQNLCIFLYCKAKLKEFKGKILNLGTKKKKKKREKAIYKPPVHYYIAFSMMAAMYKIALLGMANVNRFEFIRKEKYFSHSG